MQVLLLASHEYGRQHCPVAVQSAPSVLGFPSQVSSPPEGVDGAAGAGATAAGAGAVSSIGSLVLEGGKWGKGKG